AVERYAAATSAANEERLESGSRRDFDLYQSINRRLTAGEGYYEAALAEQRASGFPTKPFVTVRPPTLAWSSLVLGLEGWRLAALGLWLATVLGLYAALA